MTKAIAYEYHDCKKPNIPTRIEEYKTTKATLFKIKTITKTRKVYIYDDVKWVCPECGTSWFWYSKTDTGFWSADGPRKKQEREIEL